MEAEIPLELRENAVVREDVHYTMREIQPG
jgi:hypothetical protein